MSIKNPREKERMNERINEACGLQYSQCGAFVSQDGPVPPGDIECCYALQSSPYTYCYRHIPTLTLAPFDESTSTRHVSDVTPSQQTDGNISDR